MKEILAVIPARSGSKGLPNKNILDVGGMPLIAHSIRAARMCRHISRVVVSTDQVQIAGIAEDYGAEVPFLRPEKLARDDSKIGDAVSHVLRELERKELYLPYAVVVLLPTHLFRSWALMDLLTCKLLAGHGVVSTVRRFPVDAASHFMPKGDKLLPLRKEAWGGSCYRPYGLFSGFLHNTGAGCSRIYRHEIRKTDEFFDVDCEEDLLAVRDYIAFGPGRESL